MSFRFLSYFPVLAVFLLSLASGQVPENGNSSNGGLARVPSGIILVKGAWSSASDSDTPLPEGGIVANNSFSDRYFGMTYALPRDWAEKYKGPPPSDTGHYVLAQLGPAATFKGSAKGTILITAQDMFFTTVAAGNAAEFIDYMKDHLQSDYQVELPPNQIKIADRVFTYFAYWSPVAQLHWYVFATQIRCHVVQITLSSRDTKLLQDLMLGLNNMKLPLEASSTGGAGGGAVPACVKNYARGENVIARVNPVFAEHRFNPVPVRIIIGKEGKVKHIHILSAFPNQTKAITDALDQWKFKPYLRDGQPVEVETGILFGRV
jgi:Gram-negative bacterial TonB protein C-terminal